MARPNGHTAEEIADAIRKANGMVSLAARDLGVSRMTVYRYIDRYATVKEALTDAREQLLDMTESELFKAIKAGNVTAIMFALKTIGKDRGYVERSQIEHSGADGDDITVRIITSGS